MSAPFAPERPVRPPSELCPFCNEVTAGLWLDPARESLANQVRCAMCGARGPWGDNIGAVEGWESVRPIMHDEEP